MRGTALDIQEVYLALYHIVLMRLIKVSHRVDES